MYNDEAQIFGQFLAVMQRRDLALSPNKRLIADGEWHRCNAINKPRNNEDGSYVLHMDGPAPWGLFRNWTDGKGVDHWRGEINRALSADELEELERHLIEVEIEAERHAEEMAAEAATNANETWQRAQDAPANHPYLAKKKIKVHGTKVKEGLLLVPIIDADGDIVNIQEIAADGKKWFLKGGRVTGCAFEIEGDIGTVILAEGFATAAKINEDTGYTTIVAFGAGNLAAVASAIRSKLHSASRSLWRVHQDAAAERGLRHERQTVNLEAVTRFIVAADDDYQTAGNPGLMKGLAAARVAKALIAVPDFGKRRMTDAEGATDFDDMSRLRGGEAIKKTIDAAVPPQVLLEKRLLADPHAAHANHMIEELAAWKQHDAVVYEKLLAELKKKGVRQRELDSAVKNAIKTAAAKAAAARARQRPVEEADANALAESASEIIASDNVLDMFGKAFAKTFVGEQNNAKLLYLNCMSRLFGLKETMHSVVKGPSAVGKSALLGSVTAFMPKESVFRFTSLSDKALLYLPDGGDLSHKILLMAEVPKDEKQQQFQNLLLRELMSEGVLHYPVVQKVGDQFETVTIEVKGPVAFLVSTTKTEVDPENETRMLSLEMDDSRAQTAKVMLQVARREGFNQGPAQIDFAPWHDFQRWLATAGERRVYIYYATDLAKLIPANAVRLRRDIGQVLRAIKAHALIHREHRKRGEETGAIMATLDDYKAVRALMVDPLSETAEVKMRASMVETIEAVESACADSGRDGATVNEIADILRLDTSATRRRLNGAMKAGRVILVDARKGYPYLYATTAATMSADAEVLPSVEAVREAYKQRKAGQAQNNLRTAQQNRAHLPTPRSSR